MKTFVAVLALVAATSAQIPTDPSDPNFGAGPGVGFGGGIGGGMRGGIGAGPGAGPAAGTGRSTGGLGGGLGLQTPRQMSNRVWGLGANDPFAANPFVLQRYIAVANNKNLLVRVDGGDDIELTNNRGLPVKLRNIYGDEVELE